MNNILFDFDGHEVEVIQLNGVVLFNAKHVAKVLEIKNVNDNLRKMNKNQVVKLTNSKIGNTDFRKLHNTGENFLTESGVYKLVFKSRKPDAEKFSDWIADEVLPMINKTGGYIETDREEEFVNNYLPDLSEETKILVIRELHDNNEKLKAENAELKEFYDTLMSTEGLLSMNTVAKELGVGLKRLYLFLRNNDVMFYKGNVNIPYQRFMEQGLFKVKETPCADGNYRPVSYATRKGLEYIRKLLVKKNQICTE